ncbi:aminopeptidase N [Copidosoma floridanum]|uniref:aminopeptidase N n=1 Tax=Copidosoma floridanum TaxID=29053 RepID=UPI0006C98713|nr:aminopeptidase N [Copidosoma floridanum]
MLRVAKALIIIGCFCIQTYADETTTNSISINTEDKQTANVRPINYNIILTPYFTDRNSEKYLTFESVVEIELQVERSVNNITLLSNKLLFGRENCSLQTSDGVDIQDFSVDFEPNENLVSFTKSYDQFPQEKLLLKINYTGTISKEEKAGIFIDFYINEKKENVSFIIAILRSKYTSSVLPCFLESDHKATFDVTINDDKNYVALSSMSIKNVSYEGSTATSVFKKTPPMDINQLGLCVLDFKNISNDAENITVWTTQELLRKKLDFANTSTQYWLTNHSMTVCADVKPKDWIIVNKQYTGFYIVNYDKTNWELIIDYLMSPDYKKIHLFNRYQLLNDAFLLAHEDKLDLTILLRLHSYLKNETNCLAWYPGFLVLDWLGIQLVYTESYPKFQEYALKIMQKLIDTIGFRENEQDDDFTKTCRARLFSVACKMGHQLCHKIALEKFEAWLRDPINNLIASNLEDAVLCYGLHNYENLDELFTSLDNKSRSYDPNTVESLNNVAGCSGNETFLRKRLNKFKNDSILDTFTLLSMMLDHNAIKLDTTLDLVTDDLYKIIRWKRNNIMPLLFENAAGKVTSQSQRAKISRPIYRRAYKNAVNRGLDKSNKRIEWLKRNEQSVVNFITELPQQQPLHDSNEKTIKFNQ